MPAISNTPRPGYAYDSTDDVWYPIGTGPHTHDYAPSGGVISPTVVDAKGDIIAATAADTVARLAVGNNGETLVADSSATTGLRYQPSQAAGRNTVINGGMDIWQRGTSFAVALNTNTFASDRWCGRRGATGMTLSRQTTSDTTNLPFIQYGLRIQRDSGNTALNPLTVAQSLETVNSIPYAGRTVTVSYYARRGANFSATSNAFNCDIYTGTGTDENVQLGYTGSAQSGQVTATLTTTWQRFSGSVNIPSTATEIGLYFNYTPTGTAGAADFVEVTGVQLELGSVATTFSRNAGTIQGELAACQRYYYRVGSGDSSNNYCAVTVINNVNASSTTTVNGIYSNPVPMRTVPTSLDYSTIGFHRSDGTVFAITAVTIDTATDTSYGALIGMTVSGVSAGNVGRVLVNNSVNGYFGVNCEL